MKIAYDHTVDALSLFQRSGEYYETIPLQLEGVDLNLDLDESGNVLQLEVLSAGHLLDLMARHGGELVIPERIEDPEAFSVMAFFPKAATHA